MAYCAKCGTKNEDDATFCKNCGASLTGAKPDYARDRDKRCEEECAGGKGGRGWMMFWGVIIILIGLAILFEFVLKDMAKTYPTQLSWVNFRSMELDFRYCDCDFHYHLWISDLSLDIKYVASYILQDSVQYRTEESMTPF